MALFRETFNFVEFVVFLPMLGYLTVKKESDSSRLEMEICCGFQDSFQ
jgi:hypothetical protein